MSVSERNLPALVALRQRSQVLHSDEINDLGTMTCAEFWHSLPTALEGHSTLICGADPGRIADLLRHCEEIREGCLILSVQQADEASGVCALFPLGVTEMPCAGGIVLWEPGGVNLRTLLSRTRELFTVVLLPGLQISADVLGELYALHSSRGFLLISRNLRQEMAQHPGDIPTLFAADRVILHGPSDPETICPHLPRTKVNQPAMNTVINFHNPTMPLHSGAGKPLLNRGAGCGKVHKLSFSLAQSMSLVERPLFEAGELRKNRNRTILLDNRTGHYYQVTLQDKVCSLSAALDRFFEHWMA